MKAILLKVLFCGLFAISSLGSAHTKDQIIPWPLGHEIAFPWQTIEGLWVAHHNDQSFFFNFVVVRVPGEQLKLKVEEIAPNARRVIAKGVGIETDRIVFGLVLGKNNEKYRIWVRVYREEFADGVQDYTVLTAKPFHGSDEMHFILDKVSNTPLTAEDVIE